MNYNKPNLEIIKINMLDIITASQAPVGPTEEPTPGPDDMETL